MDQGLAGVFDDDSASERQNSLSTGDLDPFLLQGDDQTWAVEDWNWDPFNMFAAPKEVPAVACCQALKRRKVGEDTATSTAPQAVQQHQQQHCGQSSAQPCHGPGHGHRGPAAACCAGPTGPSQPTGPLHAALNHIMPGRVMAQSDCGVVASCHAPTAPPIAPPIQAAVGSGAPGSMGANRGHMGWSGGMAGFQAQAAMGANAAGAAAAAAQSFFPAMGMGMGMGTLTGWGHQQMALQMPNLAMPAFPGGTMQCAPAMNVQPSFPGPPSGIFNQQASVAMPPSAIPSPALGSSGDTSSRQGSADNAKPPCCSGNRGAPGPTCSGGRQQADSRNQAAPAPPTKVQHGRGNAEAAAPGDLSDFAFSDSEDEDAGRRAPAGQRAAQPPQQPQQHHFGDVVALHDVADDSGLMVCQVPGCGKDLTNLKEYHQRYRICDVHIKLQQVMKDGRLQRFCQQCGRFHDLTACDGSRKSCRDQLSKHNARRRRRAQAEQAKGKATDATPAGGSAGLAAAGMSLDGDVGRLLASLMQNPTQLHALRLLLGVSTHPALPAAQPAAEIAGFVGANEEADAGRSDQARTYALARDILAGRNEFSPAFESEHRMVRLSMKLFNRTPADLPADLRNQITSWLASAPAAMEASIRPGCVFLTVQMLVDEVVAAQVAAPGALKSLCEHLVYRTGSPFWSSGMYTVQLGTDILLVRDGRLCPDKCADGRFPVISRLGPLAAVAGKPAVLKLTGHHLDAPGCVVILRWAGKHAKVPLQAVSSHHALVRLPPLPDTCGPIWVEVARGAFMSPPKQLLVARDESLVSEINKLDVRSGPMRQEVVEAVVQDLGLVLQHIASVPGAASQLPHASIALKARRLLATACDMGWAAVAAAVLPLACARCSCAADMVAAIHAASVPSNNAASADQRGLTLLHRAVRSKSLPLLAGMLAWGDSHGYRWRVDAAGPAGITPLHLSAMLDDARVGLLLLDHCGWPAAFTQIKSDGGVTPFHLAFQMGHYQVDRLMSALGGLHQVDPHAGVNNALGGTDVAALHHPPSRRSRCGSSAPMMGCVPDEDEDVKPDLRGHVKKEKDGKDGCCSELDPCEVCHCTLPPLLLSIMARCNDCGRRRFCLDADTEAAAPGGNGSCSCGGARPNLRSELGEVCNSRQHHTVFSITALCQGCHANRVLAVA